ncbi:MAG: M56 family metallopeptidase, partial [Chthoniobacteraceae bacterium]
MNRTLFSIAALFGALMPLVFDATLKGAVLLATAALVTLALWRASAAARHLVWLVAVVALLIVPVLSLALPQWRVLPQWAVVEQGTKVTKGTEVTKRTTAPAAIEDLQPVAEDEPLPERTAIAKPLAPRTAAASSAPIPHPASRNPTPTWREWLPLAWCVGFALLAIRLLAAHLLLRRAARRCPALTATPDEKIAAAFVDACTRLGITQRGTLLLDKKRTIPVVWGVFRPRLMLPLEAREWSDEQLYSVLLHELGHIKRRDTLVQWLTQIACALHWWNPLVWLAAWRLHVERERACDDLVLASGVRPSDYAEHLLNIATNLSPARWTSACGLAMARKSSLEGRLLAVLSEKLNRRGVTSALAAIALILGAGIAIPIAMLRAAEETWNPPHSAHIGGNDFSTYSVRDGNETAFVLAYQGDFDSMSSGGSNSKTRTWTNSGEITAKKPGIIFSFRRVHTAPDKLTLTSAPSGARDLSKPAPPPRDFGQKEYDLTKGRVFLLRDDGGIRQLDIAAPRVTDHEGADKLAKLIAPIPPQERVALDAKPKHKDARELYEIWQRHARANGDIPGALIGELAAAVKVFIGYNPTWETVPKLNTLLPRLDATHDWKSADAIALLDEVAAIKDSPLSMAMRRGTRHAIRNGEALPEKFADAPWSGGKANGLRVAWVLEPGAAEHRIGAALKARLLVWNPGATPVMLQVPTWHQGGVKATDAKDAEVEVSGISWTTVAQLVPCRLGPGEYIEIYTPGIGFGPRAGMGPWAGPRVGSSVLAKPGDELTLTHSPVPLDGSEVGMSEDDPHVIGPGWWLAHIKARLSKELPLPADAAERTRLLDRAVRDLFGSARTAEETAAFVADKTPDPLDALIKRLAAREDVVSFSGKLQPAPAKFRVLAADANAGKQPRVALGPGQYPLPTASAERGDATLKIVGRPVRDRRTNDAQLMFEATEFTGALAPDPHKLEVPDGWGTWAIVCRPSDGFLYVLHKGGVRKIDFTNPRKVTDTPANDLPAEFRDEVKRQLEAAGVSAESQAEVFEKPAPPAKTPEPKTGAVSPEPKNEYALAHFRLLQKYARENSDIPGGLIALLDRSLGVGLVTKLDALGKRLDATRDWTAKETA